MNKKYNDHNILMEWAKNNPEKVRKHWLRITKMGKYKVKK